ncbi:SHOCT domain-containing protein [Rhodococcus triatomae]|uniref:Short C-terminal domain-containing protein n=1 Tax=Rhodococcus triatomae TaxID=300028 RepID=A0A1G8RZV0_9NOCA|nr:SHOCT domain-containing protein [Rhodococcus triatomae]QNG17356.1 SHOCT domain-containing protein [Rhodococcus triatomae]QNG22977.1 SHOCT domain-containing protein [Rhodococcus triatomae]SDJ22498.1 Short C-terminal domain-containing protein [Rhodococcus triatomae]
MLDSIWDLLWYTIVVFAFVAYLLILFQILGDLFRDKEISAVARIIWIVFLVLIPYLTAFVYLVVRGRGMTERHIEADRSAKDAADSYIRDVAGKTPADEIATAKALLDAGTITQAEFDQLKAKALS